jgi:hypothetical protein
LFLAFSSILKEIESFAPDAVWSFQRLKEVANCQSGSFAAMLILSEIVIFAGLPKGRQLRHWLAKRFDGIARAGKKCGDDTDGGGDA